MVGHLPAGAKAPHVSYQPFTLCSVWCCYRAALAGGWAVVVPWLPGRPVASGLPPVPVPAPLFSPGTARQRQPITVPHPSGSPGLCCSLLLPAVPWRRIIPHHAPRTPPKTAPRPLAESYQVLSNWDLDPQPAQAPRWSLPVSVSRTGPSVTIQQPSLLIPSSLAAAPRNPPARDWKNITKMGGG